MRAIFPNETGTIRCPRDRYHDQVKNALIKEGWTITDDPLQVKVSKVYDELFMEPIGQMLLKNRRIRLIVFDVHSETIRQWIPQNPIAS